jgi:hypothetical protein
MRKLALATMVAAMALTGCGGSSNGSSTSSTASNGATLASVVGVTGVGPTTNFGFDLGTIVGDRYYFTDRNNASVDVFTTSPSVQQIAQIKGTGANAFAGNTGDNGTSGPDGINAVGNLIYAGDVNSVKIIDPVKLAIIKTITVGTTGKRADEACVDPTHNLYMISSPDAALPFASIINTTTQTLVATITFSDAAGKPVGGLEQCRYDAATDAFYVNNDATTANPRGELDVLPGASIRAIAAGATVNYTDLPGLKAYPLGLCDPTGLAIGPGNDIAVNCREGVAGDPLLVQILDKTTGAILASVNAGGGDQLEYEATANRYYSAASRWTKSGTSSGPACTAASPCTPVLATIDAGTRKLISQFPTGNNAHSVAVDPVSKRIFLPISSDASPAGCSGCNFGTAGLMVVAQ